MQTIQEYLKKCDREQIVSEYVYKYAFSSPLELLGEEYRTRTIGEIVDAQREAVERLIDRLVSITPKQTDERWYLLSVHIPETEGEDVQHILVKENDILDESLDFVTPHGYELTPHEESVGFFAADTYLTQHHLTDVLVDFLWECSFTGYEQEHLGDVLEGLEKAKEEIECGNTIPFSEAVSRWEREFGIAFEQKDVRQIEAFRKWLSDCAEYGRICEAIEIEKLRKLILEESIK